MKNLENFLFVPKSYGMRSTMLFLIVLQQTIAMSQSNFWQQTNGPTLGTICSLSTDSSNRIYAGFVGGIALSTDFGNTWTRVRGTLDSSKVTTLVSKNGGLIFAGTWGQGVFKSTDNGMSWVKVGSNFSTEHITGIVLTPTSNLIASGFSGLFFTSDDGTNWSQIFTGNAKAVAVDSSERILVATDHISDRSGERGGIYRSSNNGISWDRVNSGLPSSYFYPQALLVSTDQKVYLGLEGAFYSSSDNGTTWSQTNIGNTDISVVAVKRNGHLFAGNGFVGAIYRSIDNGLSWLPNGIGMRNFRIYSFTEDLGGNFYVATNGDIYETANDGESWHKVNSGYTYVTTTDIALHPNSSIWAVAGFYNVGSGVFVSTNNGIDWTEKSFGPPEMHYGPITIDRSGVVFMGTYEVVFVTTDLGENWMARNDGLDSLYSYAIFAGHQNYVYVSTGGLNRTDPKFLYRSTDQGLHWSKASVGLPSSSVAGGFAVDSNDNVYASVDWSGAYRSSNQGESWIPINNGFPDTTSVGPIVVNSLNHLFASNYPYGLFRSTDGGNLWVLQSNSGLTEPSIITIAVDHRNNLYAGTWNYGGVFVSTDEGTIWASINTGLGPRTVWALSFDRLGFLLAGTYGNGIYRSLSPTVGIQQETGEIPAAFSLHQNYPNPFNPTTIISFSIPHRMYTLLRVFNMLGQVVATPLSENLDAGLHSIKWDATNIASGVYFYRLQAEKFSVTKKLLLLK